MIVQRLVALALALLAAATLSAPAYAQTPEARFAFVIGNDGYEGAQLKTAANDAGLVAETLRGSGFDVTGARNLDQETLRASFREFLDKVAAAGPSAVAAIYLSGYGLQVEGENYLVPVGSRVQRDTDVNLNAIRISDLLRALGGIPAKARIAMLDLAYDGPFGKQGQPLAPGLELVEAPNGMLVGFNAAPGTVAPKPTGDYGPYAQALSETMRIPGLPLDDIFARVRTRTAELTQGRQVPWHVSRIDPNFLLMERAPDAPPPAVTAQQIQDARARPIRDFSDAEAYSAAIDRDTIGAYQDFLAAYPQSRYAPAVRGLLAARREALTWRRTTNVNSPNAYWSYLQRYPKGPHAADARRRLARLSAPLDPPSRFEVIDYDVAPPPDTEVVYFERDVPTYFADALPPPRVAYMPPPPAWWTPPPPPPEEVIIEETYFLPTPVAPPPPAWVRPPAYVVDAPEFYRSERRGNGGGASIVPYVAIPAALAAGIAAGKLLDRSARRPDQQGRPPLPNQAPNGGPVAPQRQNFIPPVTQAPRPITQIQQQQGTVGQPVQRPAPQPQAPAAPLPQGAAPQPQQGPVSPQLQRPGGLPPQGQPQPQAAPPQPQAQPSAPNQPLPRPGGAPGTPPTPQAQPGQAPAAPNQLPRPGGGPAAPAAPQAQPGPQSPQLPRPGGAPAAAPPAPQAQPGQAPAAPNQLQRPGGAPPQAQPAPQSPQLPRPGGAPAAAPPAPQAQPGQAPAAPNQLQRPGGAPPPQAQPSAPSAPQQQLQRQQEQQRLQDQQRVQEQQRLQQQRQQDQQRQQQESQRQQQQQQQIQRQQEIQRQQQQQQQIQRQQQIQQQQQQQQQIQRQQEIQRQQQQQQQIQRQQQIQQQQQQQQQIQRQQEIQRQQQQQQQIQRQQQIQQQQQQQQQIQRQQEIQRQQQQQQQQQIQRQQQQQQQQQPRRAPNCGNPGQPPCPR